MKQATLSGYPSSRFHKALDGTAVVTRDAKRRGLGWLPGLAAKMARHNFCIWLNQQLGRPPLAFADLVAW